MKFFKTGLIASLLTMAGVAHADNDAALSLMALQSGNTSLVELAPEVRKVSQGVVTEIELDDYRDQTFAFQFKVIDLAEGYEHEMKYSVQDGSLLKHETESLTTLGFSDLDQEDQVAIEQVQQAKFDIFDKIVELETKYKAKMIEAELENKKGIVFYEVELASAETGHQKLLINVATGEEIPKLKRK